MFYTIIACILPSLCSALICTIIGSKILMTYSKPLTLVAVGFLITLSVTHIIPEAMQRHNPHQLGVTMLIGFLLMILIEMFTASTLKNKYAVLKSGVMGILSGSYLHTLCDGFVIASAFIISDNLGLAVALAILSHEVAHELGDYAIMLECNLSLKQAYIVNIVAFLGCMSGGIIGYFVLSVAKDLIPYALVLSGTTFIYVSLSDLLPRLLHSSHGKKMYLRYFYIVLGVMLSLIIASHD